MVKLRCAFLAIAITLLTTANAYSDSIPRTQFVEVEPFNDPEQLACTRKDDHSWHVQQIANALVISEWRHVQLGEPTPPDLKAKLSAVTEKRVPTFSGSKKMRDLHPVLVHTPSAFLRTKNGWLVGFDAGEFGGGLWWFDENSDESFSLDYLNVHDIKTANGEIVVGSGLAHSYNDTGRVSVFMDSGDGPPKRVRVLKTPSSVEALMLTDAGLVAATFAGPLHVNSTGAASYDGDSSGPDRHLTYPTSIAANENGDIFVGARYAVLVYRGLPEDFSPKWLVPKTCVRFIPADKNNRCSCVAAE